MIEATKALWAELRKPFPKGTVGLLPKPYKRDSPKGQCNECGKYHGLPAMHVDYVGHAAVTDRLNMVVGPDNWDLSPMATDESGNPVTNRHGELWCWLTIMGTKKMCVGDGSESSKELIGDALRNGAMRFGIALDLWSKEELESTVTDPALKNDKPSSAPDPAPRPSVGTKDEPATPIQKKRIQAFLQGKGLVTPDAQVKYLEDTFGIIPGSPMTKADAENILQELQAEREGA